MILRILHALGKVVRAMGNARLQLAPCGGSMMTADRWSAENAKNLRRP
ncbi:MAG TPA: hypothetical protein VFW94_00605 [Candidatus Acidoferrales bacterium]|nr:hypothetical protein [Candidatus Acidoferrales bacterium]